jgi:Reverse transcriptase (RNA-dependent DNA polymerase)
MDTLSPSSLDWALLHIQKYGDTDIFPVPFEFEAIRHGWVWLQKELSLFDLETYRIGSLRRILVPKPSSGFRVATQLDPIDSLIYTAAIYEAAEAIERSRVPIERKIACSFRLGLDASGTFFRANNGWPDFQEHSSELASSGRFSHVLLADISDFYNQIYHHRLENALADAEIPEQRRKNIASFISQITATQSRGIPVGPFASIILAEACLNDVDSYLLRKGYPHTRYVDDFRIFCTSRREAIRVLHDLCEYLNTSQRLSLETSKIRILSIEKFCAREMLDPEKEEEQGRMSALKALTEHLRLESGYGEEDITSKPDKTLMNKAARDNLVVLLQSCLAARPLHLGMARHILRRAAQLRTNVLLPLVFDNLESLTPVLRDVAKYVKAAVRKSSAPKYGAKLTEFLNSSDCADIPYVRLWCLEMIIETPALVSSEIALRLAESYQGELGLRYAALMARTYKQADWARQYKETWRNNRDWDRRAIIWAGSIFPADERRHWLGLVQGTTSSLDKAIAQKSSI